MRPYVLFIVLLVASMTCVQAQDYPAGSIKIIVPFAPGAGTDTLARLLAGKIQESSGLTMFVENQAGAGGLIGMSTVARAAPNGLTLGLASPSTHTIAAATRKQLPYDPIKDFTLISTIVKYTSVLVVHPQMPLKSVTEFVQYAKKYPDKLSFASAGVGSSTHLLGEMFSQAAQIKIVHVPFKGGGQSLPDLLGGHIPVAIISVAGVQGFINQGKLRALAVFERERYAGLQHVPAITEELPGMNPRISWFGLVGPAGLPPAVTARLNKEVRQALQAADFRKKLQSTGFQSLGGTPEQFTDMVREEIAAWSKVVTAANFKVME
ncbi:MAG: tripartite tricarboxylate transporter substrate binding protein [Betaproteobacteria bacterium]|nr:tripartite tricarboxylate transporter substrate binding protein [Betaproteobacteria bacterium]